MVSFKQFKTTVSKSFTVNLELWFMNHSMILIMLSVINTELVFTHLWWFWMEILKASTSVVEITMLSWPLHCVRFIIIVTVCYAHVSRPACGGTLKMSEALHQEFTPCLHACSCWLPQEFWLSSSPELLPGRCDG